ncbi:hypothetical protein NicSoilC12_33890 [Arthrobacter sp. NicSoilC12]|nr:hypothetical protein NicSoilC12_33890 [Arthrobacter sp. NicSoilC12]
MTTFAALGTPKALADTLTAQGIVEPFPIQVKTLPDTLSGRDVLGRGRTGSGKTIAFAIPLVARLAEREAKHFRKPGRPMGLVLAPTRELATQINATIEPMAKAMGLTTTVIYGGISQARQEKALRAGVDIVIACPGRLEDLIRQRILTLEAVEITVLDEADHMADLGFLPVVKKLMDMTPTQGQRLLFSATLDNGVDKIVQRYLSNPLTPLRGRPAGRGDHHGTPRAGGQRPDRQEAADRRARLRRRPPRALHAHQAPRPQAGQDPDRRRHPRRRSARQPLAERP